MSRQPGGDGGVGGGRDEEAVSASPSDSGWRGLNVKKQGRFPGKDNKAGRNPHAAPEGCRRWLGWVPSCMGMCPMGGKWWEGKMISCLLSGGGGGGGSSGRGAAGGRPGDAAGQ